VGPDQTVAVELQQPVTVIEEYGIAEVE